MQLTVKMFTVCAAVLYFEIRKNLQMEKGYKLSGKLIDANGRIGIIEAVVSESDSSIINWRITLSERTAEFKIEGRSKMIEEGSNLILQSMDDAKQDQRGGQWKASMRKSNAYRYANAAYLGQYQNEKSNADSMMTEGIIALWNFKQ